MNEIFLRATNKSLMDSALSFLSKESLHDYFLDSFGTAHKKPAVWNKGTLVSAREDHVGYHANIICTQEIADKIPVNVKIPRPNNPYRIIAQ